MPAVLTATRHLAILAALSLCALLPVARAAEESSLERVVLVMRHGVRPPTKSAEAMAALSALPWPDDAAWGARPGELTPHGAQAIVKLGADLRRVYTLEGLLPAGGPASKQILIWADGADQRTRATAQSLAQGLEPGDPPPTGHLPPDQPDPLIDALHAGVCELIPAEAERAAQAAGPIDTPEVAAALARLQQIMAPEACAKGPGACMAGASKIAAGATEVKLSGPLAIGATVSEALLLEYENGFAGAQFAWGRATREDLDVLLRIHEHASNLTRRTPYVATHRAAPLARFILAAMSDAEVPGTPAIQARHRLIVVTGHDTTLSNLAGIFGLDWHLPQQPDFTAPGTGIAFERWRNKTDGKAELRVRLFYQDLEQVRSLQDTPGHQLRLTPAVCRPDQACNLPDAKAAIMGLLPAQCLP
jgi:4-phytase/acid phosphatase